MTNEELDAIDETAGAFALALSTSLSTSAEPARSHEDGMVSNSCCTATGIGILVAQGAATIRLLAEILDELIVQGGA